MKSTLDDDIRSAWATLPAPPNEDLKFMAWGWGEEAAQAFVGVAPMDVDIHSHGFSVATPLLDLPPRAAASYLGPYLLSLLEGLRVQKKLGLFDDIVTRAHTLTCLELPEFWQNTVRPILPPPCRAALAQVVAHLIEEREALALTPEQVEAMTTLAAED